MMGVPFFFQGEVRVLVVEPNLTGSARVKVISGGNARSDESNGELSGSLDPTSLRYATLVVSGFERLLMRDSYTECFS